MDDIKDIAREVILAILPIAVLVVILQFFLFENPAPVIAQFIIGVVLVSLGLGLFLIGVKVGVLPLGEIIGSELPQRGSIWLLMFFTMFLGIAVTVAEPDVRVLAHQVDLVSGGEVSKNVLVSFVAIGVGIFMVIAVARIILGVPMKYLLIGSYAVVFILSSLVPTHFVPISFDAGGVTTGPMTVPFIMALGVGITSVLGGKSTLSDSFGLVALASVGPIAAVMLLGVIYA